MASWLRVTKGWGGVDGCAIVQWLQQVIQPRFDLPFSLFHLSRYISIRFTQVRIIFSTDLWKLNELFCSCKSFETAGRIASGVEQLKGLKILRIENA